MLPTIQLLGTDISTYWLLYSFAFLAAAAVAFAKSKQYGIDKWGLVQLLAVALVSGTLGAKITGALYECFVREWSFEVWIDTLLHRGGTAYGAVAVGVVAVLIFAKAKRMNIKKLADALTFAVITEFVIAAYGCLAAGCCGGVTLASGTQFPSQIVESTFNLAIMAALQLTKPEKKHPGVLLPIWLIAYCSGRFVLDFFRTGDNHGTLEQLATSQWIALALIVATSTYLLWDWKWGKGLAERTCNA